MLTWILCQHLSYFHDNLSQGVDLDEAPKKGPNWSMMVPILYAPVLPLIRIGLRGKLPQPTIDKIFLGAVGIALSHAGTLTTLICSTIARLMIFFCMLPPGYIMLKSDCSPEDYSKPTLDRRLAFSPIGQTR